MCPHQLKSSRLDLGLLLIGSSTNKFGRIQELQSEFLKIYSFSKPIIVAVSGFCVGAGIDLICLCDLRYASENVKFSAKEIAFGIAPDLGTIPRMAMLAPEGWALEKVLTGDEFGGKEAKEVGFVSRLFGGYDEMLIAARMTAEKIAKHNSGAVQLIKKETRRVGEIKNVLDRLARGNVSLL